METQAWHRHWVHPILPPPLHLASQVALPLQSLKAAPYLMTQLRQADQTGSLLVTGILLLLSYLHHLRDTTRGNSSLNNKIRSAVELLNPVATLDPPMIAWSEKLRICLLTHQPHTMNRSRRMPCSRIWLISPNPKPPCPNPALIGDLDWIMVYSSSTDVGYGWMYLIGSVSTRLRVRVL